MKNYVNFTAEESDEPLPSVQQAKELENEYTLFPEETNLPLSPVDHLKKELRKKNKLFPKSHLQLSKVVGQGEVNVE